MTRRDNLDRAAKIILALPSASDNDADAATPDPHPDCRWLPTQIVAPQSWEVYNFSQISAPFYDVWRQAGMPEQ
jgi:hypothetical protein